MTRTPVSRRAFAMTAALAVALLLAFASPGLIGAGTFAGPGDEPHFSSMLLDAFGGVGLSLIGACVAALALGRSSEVRGRIDRLVAAGLAPVEAITWPAVAIAVGVAAITGVVGGLVVVALRTRLHLGPASLVVMDGLGTAWALFLAVTVWSLLAMALVVKSGARGLGFIVAAVDVLGRVVPGAASWAFPTSHVANLLGAPPPSGVVHVPVLPQEASVGVLVGVALLALWLVRGRYPGAPTT